ncbi:MBL fold metallo-hydrolase [Bacillus clarus]|uniref:MBL fold metallo-hydrolase n=1 Tax=Bacillus clarus TaxID=2338372 RepID=A0A090Z035_9BACI|nr:MBL fold metallo-hydrolase [Bacillus clarus]KFN03992.1 metallo-beta-lactamase superfamily protein [Bacillus clarus]RFT64383.1 MBL fold metallo-hydrolase [Bacillus clarus]
MKIANGLAMLELEIQGFRLNPTLLWDDEEAILVDTGMPGQSEQIREAMNRLNVPFDKLKTVLLTHQDIDHVGSLPEVIQKVGQSIEVYAHELDKPYIEGEFSLLKGDPNKMNEQQWVALPEPLKAIYLNPPKAKVNHILRHGQILPFLDGIEVIHTPGHTPGHVSLYIGKYKTLIAGDALVCVEGNLKGPVPRTTPDMETAMKSLEKLLAFDIDRVICYHGAICDVNVKEQLKRLVREED